MNLVLARSCEALSDCEGLCSAARLVCGVSPCLLHADVPGYLQQPHQACSRRMLGLGPPQW